MESVYCVFPSLVIYLVNGSDSYFKNVQSYILVLFLDSVVHFVVPLIQEILKLRDSAQIAAIEAMQEASAAESILRCLRYLSL